MVSAERRRRRIDRVSAPDFLDGLGERSAEEVRAMREECRAEEAEISYRRRMVQGRVDVARAEQSRREADESGSLLDALPSILADPSTGRAGQLDARYSPVHVPEETPQRRAEDAAAENDTLARLPDLDDAELSQLVEELAAQERSLSDTRRRVLDHLDTLQDELVRRYREGQVPAEDIGHPGAPPDAGESRE